MLELPQVTLLLFSPDDKQDRSNTAGKITNFLAQHVKFGASRVLSPHKPADFTGDWIKVDALPWEQAQVWQAVGLHEFFDTEFVLHCETDGFPVHFDKWDDDFLNYDFIGAPWPKYMTHYNGRRVGNGGCSLQSRKFREFLHSKEAHYLQFNPRYMVSDIFFSQFIADEAESKGIKYAPLEVARRFSFEHPIEEYPTFKQEDSFAFHGRMPWLQQYLAIPEKL